MIGTPAEFHINLEGFLGTNSWLSSVIAKLKSRLSCKCPNGMTDDEFARKFLVQGFLNIITGGAFSGQVGKGNFNEQCPVAHTLWDMLTDLGLKDLEFNMPSTCTYSSYLSQVLCWMHTSLMLYGRKMCWYTT